MSKIVVWFQNRKLKKEKNRRLRIACQYRELWRYYKNPDKNSGLKHRYFYDNVPHVRHLETSSTEVSGYLYDGFRFFGAYNSGYRGKKRDAYLSALEDIIVYHFDKYGLNLPYREIL